MKKIAFIATSLYLLPFAAFAVTTCNGNVCSSTGIVGLIDSAGQILNKLIPLLIALTVVVFFWGLVKYVSSSGKDQAGARNIMIAGITALFIMVSLWGIIRLVQNTLLPGGSPGSVTAPQVY